VSLSLYDASIPVYLQMLGNLEAILEKAEAHARAQGLEPERLLEARLAPDMHPLSRQIQMVSDAAKGGAARLAGLTPPAMPDEETSWAQFEERLARTVEFVRSIRPEQVNGRENATVELPVPGRTLTFTGRDFLFQFSLPNFFFHVTTAYGLLRSQGVPLGKLDFLAGRSAM
jgi:uncharacterized protein